jgi:hypothetical protein
MRGAVEQDTDPLNKARLVRRDLHLFTVELARAHGLRAATTRPARSVARLG